MFLRCWWFTLFVGCRWLLVLGYGYVRMVVWVRARHVDGLDLGLMWMLMVDRAGVGVRWC